MFVLQKVGLLGRVISSSQGLYLNTEQHKHRINTYTKHPCLVWVRTHDPGFRANEDSTCLRPLRYRDRLKHNFLLIINYGLKNTVFWDEAPCSSSVKRLNDSIFRVEKSASEEPAWTDGSSEMSVHTRSTRGHIPEDGILHSHHRENLRPYINTGSYGLEGRGSIPGRGKIFQRGHSQVRVPRDSWPHFTLSDS
jgi:hypothetical protein